MTQCSMNDSEPDTLNVVICGGGIIGVCTAYYLCQKSNVRSVTIIERYKIAGCASGKAGGLLALDWNDNEPTEALARMSFMLHQELGSKYGDRYQFRPTVAYEVATEMNQSSSPSPPSKQAKQSKMDDLHWIDCPISKGEAIGSKVTNAQIHPRLFCETLVDLMGRKLTIKHGVVEDIFFDPNDHSQVVGVSFLAMNHKAKDPVHCKFGLLHMLCCDAVVVAMGPWSHQAANWFPRCKQLQFINGSKVNSIVVQPTYPKLKANINSSESSKVSKSSESSSDTQTEESLDSETSALESSCNDMDDMEDEKGVDECTENVVDHLNGIIFMAEDDKVSKNAGMEIYTRPDGTVYCCIPSSKEKLPIDPSIIKCTESDAKMIHKSLQKLSAKYLAESKMMVQQACYVPKSADQIPLIGPITGYKNAFVGAGHFCWGILNGPGTGLLLSEFIADAKVTSFDESDYTKWDPSRL